MFIMINTIKLTILIAISILLSSCGGEYVYKPISYMSPTKTYEQAEAYCERKVERENNLYMQSRKEESQIEVERMRRDRIAYERANPLYSTSINCNRWGNSLNCFGSSSPSLYNSINTGYSPSEGMRMAGADLGNALGSLFSTPGQIEDCMESQGYEKVKVEERGVVVYKDPVVNQYFKKEKKKEIKKTYTQKPNNKIINSSSYETKDDSYWGKKFFDKADKFYEKQNYTKAVVWYEKSSKKGYVKAKRKLDIVRQKLKESQERWGGSTSKSTQTTTKPKLDIETDSPVINSYSDDLKKIKSLFDSGIINQDEFNIMKQKVIDRL